MMSPPLDALTVAFIVVTVLAASLGASPEAMRRSIGGIRLLVLVLAANLIAAPLFGWAIGAALAPSDAATVALCLMAASPGGPLETRFVMLQRGDVETEATAQSVLAVVGSVTFAPTAGLLLGRVGAAWDVTVAVGPLILAVVLRQMVPSRPLAVLHHEVVDLSLPSGVSPSRPPRGR